jgi:hypothetical protein
MKFRQANLLQKLALNAVARSLEDHQMRLLEKEFNKVCVCVMSTRSVACVQLRSSAAVVLVWCCSHSALASLCAANLLSTHSSSSTTLGNHSSHTRDTLIHCCVVLPTTTLTPHILQADTSCTGVITLAEFKAVLKRANVDTHGASRNAVRRSMNLGVLRRPSHTSSSSGGTASVVAQNTLSNSTGAGSSSRQQYAQRRFSGHGGSSSGPGSARDSISTEDIKVCC